MPGFLTDFTNNNVLDCLFGGRAMIPPHELHIGLSLTKAYKGGYIAEPLGAGYARVAIPNDLIHFPSASLGQKSNASAITFPEPSAGWGSIRSVFVADAPQGGNVLAMADLPLPRTVGSGDPGPKIAVDALIFSHA